VIAVKHLVHLAAEHEQIRLGDALHEGGSIRWPGHHLKIALTIMVPDFLR
jgi:hypothetical protein